MNKGNHREKKYAVFFTLGFGILILLSVVFPSPRWEHLGVALRGGTEGVTEQGKTISIESEETPLGAVRDDLLKQTEASVVDDSVVVRFSFNPTAEGLQKPAIDFTYRTIEGQLVTTDWGQMEIPKAIASMTEVDRIENLDLDLNTGFKGCRVFFKENIAYTVKGAWTFPLSDEQGRVLSKNTQIEAAASLFDFGKND